MANISPLQILNIQKIVKFGKYIIKLIIINGRRI